jgi:hypothetical protein
MYIRNVLRFKKNLNILVLNVLKNDDFLKFFQLETNPILNDFFKVKLSLIQLSYEKLDINN